ncbi:hypothetical protein ABK040_007433 [Willaertia magna]
MSTEKATLEEIFGSDYDDTSSEDEIKEEVQSPSSDKSEKEEEQENVRRTRLQVEKERRLEEELKRQETQEKLQKDSDIVQSLIYINEQTPRDENKVLKIKNLPRPDSNEVFYFRPPNQFQVNDEEFKQNEEDSNISPYTIRWRKNEETGEIESNARLVKYEDGTYQIFVGDEPILNLESKALTHNTSFQLFTKINPFVYYSHGPFTHRLTAQATKVHIGRDIDTTETDYRKKKTMLTSKKPIYDDDDLSKKVKEEAQNLKRRQNKKQQQYQHKLSLNTNAANDLLEEGASSSSDEEGNVKKIKQRTLGKNKRGTTASSSTTKRKKRGEYDSEEEASESPVSPVTSEEEAEFEEEESEGSDEEYNNKKK